MLNSSVSAAPDVVESRPLDAAEADRLLAPLSGFRRLALAVSGGADSLCLLWLAAEWRRRRQSAGLPVPVFLVLTVDHGLRPEARLEAEAVLRQSAALGLEAEKLVWSPPPQLSNLQAEARAARYALMAEAMGRAGAEALVTAHQSDDQIETFLDRLTRGSGVFGLRGMAADEPCGPSGLRLLRPMLGVPGSRLRATLATAGLQPSLDPSNTDPRFKRVRLRGLCASLASEGLHPSRLLATARHMASAAEALDAWTASVLATHFRQHPAGPARLETAVFAALPEAIRLRLLQRVLCHVGGTPLPPRFDRLERLDNVVRKGSGEHQTLAGCVVVPGGADLLVWREPGRKRPGTVVLHGGQKVIWDDRFRVCLAQDHGPVRIEPVGTRFAALDRPLRQGFPAVAFSRSPLIFPGADKPPLVPGFSPLLPGLEISIDRQPL